MKKLIALLLSLIMVFALTACVDVEGLLSDLEGEIDSQTDTESTQSTGPVDTDSKGDVKIDESKTLALYRRVIAGDYSLTYIQATPEQVWNIGIYYIMTEEGNFEGLETQISINGGEWQEYNTADAWGDWCLYNGNRTAYDETPRIEADSNVKLRVRFLGTHGPSEWSNVLELNGGGTQVIPENPGSAPDDKPATDTEEKCSLCGFCSVPLGLCIFIWLAIILLILIVIILVIILIATRPKKCKNCGQKLKKKEKTCPKCGKEQN